MIEIAADELAGLQTADGREGRSRARVCGERLSVFRSGDLGLLVLAVSLVWMAGRGWKGWVLMWACAFAVGLAAKWLTFREARNKGLSTPKIRTLGWFLLWPGLDGRAFFGPKKNVSSGASREWGVALVNLSAGATLIWGLAPRLVFTNRLAAGWLAMVGMVLLLHFGVFHLMALLWQRAGVNAEPIMRKPLLSKSVTEFWSERWNRAFSIPARRLVFLPLARKRGVTLATMAVFLVSGALHELVISIPAGGGFGMPMAYFLLQGIVVLAERSKVGQDLGMGHGFRGWVFTLAITGLPAFWLFHERFVYRVILPMLFAVTGNGA